MDKDDAKWSQFPKDKVLKILMYKELKELGLDIWCINKIEMSVMCSLIAQW